MDVTASVAIARPVEAVFAFMSNYEHDLQWRAGIIEMTQTPPGRPQIGTQTREVARFFGQTTVTPGEVTAYEPDREIAFTGLMSGAIRVSGRRTVEPMGEDTRFVYQATVELRGILWLLGPLIAARLRKRVAGDLRRLKERVETTVEATPGRSGGDVPRG
jgi:uncharacterized protein YndB with AHSA1/START domain